jgi:futalosine hydrolase
VVAATLAELAGAGSAETLCCGIGPVEAAAATASALAASPPALVLNAGIAGARRLPPPALVLGCEAVYADLALSGQGLALVARIEPDPGLLAAARRALPGAHVLPIATSARVGGGGELEVEAMEGFGVLRAAAQAGVPALELRAISNGFGDPRARWQVSEALEALSGALALLVEALGA